MWNDSSRPMTSFEVIELGEMKKCVSKVDPKSQTKPKELHPIGRECGEPTNQALLISGLPNMGRRKVQMPTCEGHIKIYMGETKGPVVRPEAPISPGQDLRVSPMLCPDCGKHPISQPCRLGPRRVG